MPTKPHSHSPRESSLTPLTDWHVVTAARPRLRNLFYCLSPYSSSESHRCNNLCATTNSQKSLSPHSPKQITRNIHPHTT